jgi:hypothetical protein
MRSMNKKARSREPLHEYLFGAKPKSSAMGVINIERFVNTTAELLTFHSLRGRHGYVFKVLISQEG